MLSKKILVVFGATGNQGGSVIKTILNDPVAAARFDIRAITRDPLKFSAVALVERGVAVVKADLDDKDSLRLALENAYAVFAVTNWQDVLDKGREIQQGKNVADVAKELHIKHLVWSSLPNVTRITNNKITGVLHCDGKALVEEYIQSIGIPYTSLHVATYFSFLVYMLQPVSQKPKSYKLSFPIPSNSKVPMISVNEDAGKYVKAILLSRGKMLGRQILAGQKFYTPDEVVKILKVVGGVDVVFEQCTHEQFKNSLAAMGMPGFVQDDFSDTMKFIEEYGFLDEARVKANQKILDERLESFQEWVAKSEMLPQRSRFAEGSFC